VTVEGSVWESQNHHHAFLAIVQGKRKSQNTLGIKHDGYRFTRG
jgi:hypothetical protein